MMKPEYDVLVIGGGPGGAFAAKTAAESGLSVCLIEKRPAIGTPVRCAEGIGQELLEEFIEPDMPGIAAKIEGARIVAPDGTTMDLTHKMAGSEVGYILDRKIFDRELIWQAAQAGVNIFVKTRAISAIMEDGAVKGAVVEYCGEQREVRAKVTIAADGVESKFSRWCGIDTTVPIADIETCAQYLMTDIEIDPLVTEFILGTEVAPEGYVWIFPKGERTANVGIGISGRKSGEGRRARDLLDRYVKQRFPDGKVIELIVGGVSASRPLECTVSDGLIIVGDAARLSDPLTGGGIYNAIFTGKLAGEVAAECIAAGDCSKEALMQYDKSWRASIMGRALERNYKIKEIFIDLDDAQLNSIVASVKSLDFTSFTTLSLVKAIAKHNPKLLPKLRHLLG